ncbi:MAG: ABC transporter permease [Desulfobacteraceae bacterium]|nr:MAG: ABC transporter permease [Desulfobacteraceae bacterium]
MMNHLTGYIGRRTIGLMEYILNLSTFTCRLLKLLMERHKTGRKAVRWAMVEQIYFTGVQALSIVIPLALITGSILISRITWVSEEYNLGKMILIIIVRELAPMITAFLVILRSASAVTIEVSYMNILNEINTIEMAGIDPMRLIALPRLVGITTSLFCLFIVFDLVSIIGGYLIVWAGTYLPMGNFLSQIGKAFTIADIAVGIVKALCFGVIITVVSLYHGFENKYQMTRIPPVTARAAVECFVLCLFTNLMISFLFYF